MIVSDYFTGIVLSQIVWIMKLFSLAILDDDDGQRFAFDAGFHRGRPNCLRWS